MDVTYTTARQVSEHLPNCRMKPGTALLLTFCVPVFLFKSAADVTVTDHYSLSFPEFQHHSHQTEVRVCIALPQEGHDKTCGRTTTLISVRHVIKGRASGWVNTLATGFAS